MPAESTLTLFIPDLFGFQTTLSQLSLNEISRLPEFKLPVLEKTRKNIIKPVIAKEQRDCGNLIMNTSFLEIAALSLAMTASFIVEVFYRAR